jgi:amino acid transporter
MMQRVVRPPNVAVTTDSMLGRIRITKRNKMNKFAILFAMLVGAFVGVGAILPALAKVRDIGAMPSAFVGSYTLGVFLLSIVGASTVFYAVRRRKAV